MVRHPHFTQPIFVRFPRPAGAARPRGHRALSAGAPSCRSPTRWRASCAQLDRRRHRRRGPRADRRSPGGRRPPCARRHPPRAARPTSLAFFTACLGRRVDGRGRARPAAAMPPPCAAGERRLRLSESRRRQSALPDAARDGETFLELVKLAHIADPHLGIRQYHRQTPAGINQREADVASAFRAAVDGVIAARPDAVVIAGDLFHSVRPTNAAIVFAFRQFQRLREALPDAPIVLIAGNHDTPALDRDRLASSGSSRSWASTSRPTRRAGWSIPALDLSRPGGAAPGAGRAGAVRRSGRRAPSGTRCSCCTARSRASSRSTGARRSTAARVRRPRSELGAGRVELRGAGPLSRAARGGAARLVRRVARVRRAPISGASWSTRPNTASPGKGWLLVDLERGTRGAAARCRLRAPGPRPRADRG